MKIIKLKGRYLAIYDGFGFWGDTFKEACGKALGGNK